MLRAKEFVMCADVNKKNRISIHRTVDSPQVAPDIDAPAISIFPMQGVIFKNSVEWVFPKDIASFQKTALLILAKLFELFLETAVEVNPHNAPR